MKHTFVKCDCNKTGCTICDGGITVCNVCRGCEGSLTTDCCGFPLYTPRLDYIYKKGLDFKNNRWLWSSNLVIRTIQMADKSLPDYHTSEYENLPRLEVNADTIQITDPYTNEVIVIERKRHCPLPQWCLVDNAERESNGSLSTEE